jgi:hypothetical protein
MRTSERVRWSRFLAGSATLARPADVAVGATSTDAARRIVFVVCLLGVAARLILINQTYVDYWSWRQSDVAAIARNFLQNGFRFGHPQIDWVGNAPGYVGTEFPILPFVAAFCYKFGGVYEWIGRIQAVILFAVSLPFFFLLVREIFGSTTAIWATFFYSFAPLNVFAGRSFMPDVPSLSFGIVGLYFFLRWVHHSQSSSFFVAAIAISLSLLIKITSIVVVAPLAYLAVAAASDRRNSNKGDLQIASAVLETAPPCIVGARRATLHFVLFTGIAFLPCAIWYWHAHQIAGNFYPHHFFGAGGIRIEPFSWYWQIAQQTLVSSLTPALSVMALVGLFVAPRSRYSRLFHWWLAGMIVFIVIVGYGNRHRWYQLQLVPIAAAFAGVGCSFIGARISSRLAAITSSILFAATFLILAFVYVRPFYGSSAAQLRNAGLELKKVTPPDALIVAADMGDPTIFYYAERKGWHFLERNAIYNGNPDDSDQAIENLEQLRGRGATHFVFTKNTFWWQHAYPEFLGYLSQHATLIEATPEFRIYKLTLKQALVIPSEVEEPRRMTVR